MTEFTTITPAIWSGRHQPSSAIRRSVEAAQTAHDFFADGDREFGSARDVFATKLNLQAAGSNVFTIDVPYAAVRGIDSERKREERVNIAGRFGSKFGALAVGRRIHCPTNLKPAEGLRLYLEVFTPGDENPDRVDGRKLYIPFLPSSLLNGGVELTSQLKAQQQSELPLFDPGEYR